MSEATKENNIRQVDGFDVILRSAMNGISKKIEYNVTVTDGYNMMNFRFADQDTAAKMFQMIAEKAHIDSF